MLRSVVAVAGGFLSMAALVGIAQFSVMKLFPSLKVADLHSIPPAYLAANIFYSVAFAVAGGWVTASVARYRRVSHAVVLAILIVIMGAISLLAERGKQPLWYAILIPVAGSGAAVLGGFLRVLH